MAKKVSAAKAGPPRTTKASAPTAGSTTICAEDAAAIVKKVIAGVPKNVYRTSELDEAIVRPILDLPEPDQSVCMTVLAEQIGELQFHQSESFKKGTRDSTWEREKAVQQVTVLERLLRRRKGHSAAQIERMAIALTRGSGSWAIWGTLVPLLLQAGKDGLLTQKALGAVSRIIKALGNHASASDRKRIAALTELLRTAKPHGVESEASETAGGKQVAATPDAARAAAVARGRQAFATYRRANASHGRYSQGGLKGMKRPDLVADLSPEESVGVVLAASEEFQGVAKDGGGLNAHCSKLFNFATVAVLDALYRRALPYTPAEFEALSESLAAFDYPSSLACPHFGAFVIGAEKWASQNAITESTAVHLHTFSQALRAVGRADEARSGTRLAEVLNQKGYGTAAAQESGLLEPVLIARETLPKEAPRSFVDALSESMAVPPEGDDKSITSFTVSALGKKLAPVISIINAALDCRPFHHTKRKAHEAEIQARAQTVAEHGWSAPAATMAAAAAMSQVKIKYSFEEGREQRFHQGAETLINIAFGALAHLAKTNAQSDTAVLGELCHALSRFKRFEFTDVNWSEINEHLAPAVQAAIARTKGKLSQTDAIRILRYRERLARAEDSFARAGVAAFDSANGIGLELPVELGERWSDRLFTDLKEMKAGPRKAWTSLLAHAARCSGSQPSAKWLKSLDELLAALPKGDFEKRIAVWFALVGKSRPAMPGGKVEGRDSSVPSDRSAEVLRGLASACASFDTPPVASALGDLAMACFKMVPGVGARCIKPGTSAIWALSQMRGSHALAQLSRVRQLVKFGTAKKTLDKSLEKLAAALKLSTDELHEIAAPDFGLEPGGFIEEEAGEFSIRLEISGADVAVKVLDGARAERKAVPDAVRKERGDTLKSLKAVAADVERILPAQKSRIERAYQDGRTWQAGAWRSRYIDHPLVGTIGRRLIWSFTRGGSTREAIWVEGAFLNERGKAFEVGDDDTVSLWHPIAADPSQVHAWRGFLEERRILQPFKQAHREIYPLTDAERNTNTYSNRFAAHIIRQNQLVPLLQDRGWKFATFVMDSGDSPRLELPRAGLHARYEVNPTGDDYYGNAGAYLYLETDRVHFSRTANGPDLPLREIPPLLFSEVMRDVDLFVAVCSVGNNPTWNDGGPNGTYRQYWHEYSFGALSGSAQSRKETLQRLIPRLKIAPVCTIEERFLKVAGKLRTYKIHFGSGNILMEPNDQYLCIVPKSIADRPGEVFLPFEGDRVLSIILSKAFMLAADDQIKDSTITRQI